MKNVFSLLLCAILIFTLSACTKNISDSNSTVSTASELLINENISNEDSSVKEDVNSKTDDTSVVQSSSQITSATPNISSNNSSTHNNIDNVTDDKENNSDSDTSKPEENIAENEKIEESAGEIIDEIPNVSGDGESENTEPVYGVDYGAFLYEGTFIDMISEGTVVYSIYRNPNEIIAYDTEKFELLYHSALPGQPAEIQIKDNNIIVSFPDLKSIRIYDKTNFEMINMISLPNVVSSFCIDGDNVYYSQHDQHCYVYRTNIVTNETETICREDGIPKSFYFPKLLLNKEKGLIYIGETGSSGSALYYYNISDLSFNSVFKKDDYGMYSNRRSMFLVNDNVFWAGYRFDSANAQNVIGEYGGGGFYYADENFVTTPNGIYITETYQYITKMENVKFVMLTSHSLVAVYWSQENAVITVPYVMS